MTKRGRPWRDGGDYPHMITVRLTKKQKEHIKAFPSQAEIIRHLIDLHMKHTG